MNKHEWRKQEKKLYLPASTPELITIPQYQFITIKGEGSPYEPIFAERIAVLYSLAYAIKMNLKKVPESPAGYQEYTVYPLEGIWDISDKTKKTFDGTIHLEELVYTMMIRQPNFVEEAFFEQMREMTIKKKSNELLDQVKFEKITDGKSVQMLHVGSFSKEPETFTIMEEFTQQQKLTRVSKIHREIYLSDYRKVAEEKLRTVLRFAVE